ncbi:putative FKBP-type peptidyl-prolyl cis-trans isomerase [Chloropicon primus]|uniref:Putative FKBP-type peptidyl-prolyl cis-trans isomerase n=1 Tax=Chloropicon primus TaxID=1764295 RepID=A0A5B8MCK6_9CHLO|nr:putative FKBP-type peptidyl-prolyl cis-trans isomerase [Chloropicon primus]UPQ97332.1 putative FKBP-type peptidyl-prolyl cis-trans isomerase [Chloropicon primus]|mmetsp:Transcript_3771/g.10830  ORF Transcript_3771/g.10830 Transcript_3771/m.10830 type:complete len:457 (-) Transcript_3771:2345-3715(-)|eukprot:QDZ18119.1 putative FKBP-type peptidyl-prolyl cis-trans isomerase [Chloropicon primus]
MTSPSSSSSSSSSVRQVQVSLAEFRDLASKQLDKALGLKEEGSRLYGEGRVEEASAKYLEVLVMIDAAKSVDALGRADFRDLRGRMEAVELVCHLNLAACALAENRYEAALEEARAALSIDGRSVKAMYRAGRALFAMSRFEEAAEALGEADRLSPSDRSIAPLLARARGNARKVLASQRAAFGGMFSKSSYIMKRSQEEEEESAARAAERESVEGSLKQCIQGGNEVSLIDRWVHNGVAGLQEEEVEALVRVAQRAAASGKLDSAKERALVAKHGLRIHAKGRGEEEEAPPSSDQQDLVRVQALTRKVQEGGALVEEEAAFLQNFRRGEILRLESQLRSTGLGEQDRMVLEGLRSQEKRYNERVVDYEKRSEEVETLLKRLESGRRVPLRQRLRMDDLLNEERIRLEAKDDEQGLTSTEWKLLRQIQEAQEEKKKKEGARRERLDQRKQALQIME